MWLKRNKYPTGYRVLCANCNHLEYLKSISNKELSNKPAAKSRRKRAAAAKILVMARLNNKCIKCSRDDMRILTVHHINNDGADHRRKLCGNPKLGSGIFYVKLLEYNDFAGLECRCFSCNDAENRLG